MQLLINFPIALFNTTAYSAKCVKTSQLRTELQARYICIVHVQTASCSFNLHYYLAAQLKKNNSQFCIITSFFQVSFPENLTWKLSTFQWRTLKFQYP